jgi:hypothetical protein
MRGELIQGVIGRLSALGILAADTLGHLMKHGGKDDHVKLNAASAILRYMLAGHGNEVLAHQAEALRRQMEESEHGAGNGSKSAGENTRPPRSTGSQDGADPRPATEESSPADAASTARPLAAGSLDEEDDVKPLFGT